MAKLIQRRFPVYLAGFLLGLGFVLIIMQGKRAMAPDFAVVNDDRNTAAIAAGGSVRLKLGSEPGKYLAWGFPTRLAVGRRLEGGRVEPVIGLEYKHLVEPETLIGPLNEPGLYDLIAHFSVCAFPGEKYCARIELTQQLQVFSGREAPAEIDLVVDLKSVAEQASEAGKQLQKYLP